MASQTRSPLDRQPLWQCNDCGTKSDNILGWKAYPDGRAFCSSCSAQAALHYSDGKSGVDQIPPSVLLAWGDVFAYGAEKYGRDNWRKGTAWSEFYASALRHLLRWWDGDNLDQESGLPHLAHALWNIGALMYYQKAELGLDNRPEQYEYPPYIDALRERIGRNEKLS